MEKKEKRKKLDDKGCAFAPRSHATIGPYPLSKLNASGLLSQKVTYLFCDELGCGFKSL